MTVRDEIEDVLRGWEQYETEQGSAPIIDYDLHPQSRDFRAASSRLAVFRSLLALAKKTDHPALISRVGADLAYLRALLGEHPSIGDYVETTQGCHPAGWPAEYVSARGDTARECLLARGIPWGADTEAKLREKEGGVLEFRDVVDALRDAASSLEPAVRALTGTTAHYDLSVTTTDVDAYWTCWLTGTGEQVRLRINLRNAQLTPVRVRQFALHEILGHGLQSASIAAHCRREDVQWVRLLSVHAPHQVMLEGIGQALPLFVVPEDEDLTTRVRLEHYLQLVRAELHLAVNSGTSVEECANHAQRRVPFWTDSEIAKLLADRGMNPLLRSYLWSYPAGLDWFVNLAESGDASVIGKVLHAAYSEPLTPSDLAALWPQGPPIGGPGGSIRLRKPDIP